MSYEVEFQSLGGYVSDFFKGYYLPSVSCDKYRKYWNYSSAPFSTDSSHITMQYDASQNLTVHTNEVFTHGAGTLNYARKMNCLTII